MRILGIMALALVAITARAQEPSEAEKAALTDIAKCMIAGLPRDWRTAEMTIELPAPGAETGDVKYVFRRAFSAGEYESFRPCDLQMPARRLVELRKQQAPDRAAWKSARFTLNDNGTFDLKYDYPKAD